MVIILTCQILLNSLGALKTWRGYKVENREILAFGIGTVFTDNV